MSLDPQQRRGILVVEDDFDTRATLVEILQDEGYHVEAAANGREALSRLRAGRLPRLIFLDLMMPVMDGWEFRQRQRGDPALAPVPVVVVSGDGNVAQKAHTLGADGFLLKPVRLANLLAMAARHCR